MRALLVTMTALLSLNAAGWCADAATSRILSNGILEVEVMDPTHPDRYYQGVRFSPVANVMQVRRDGRSFLYAAEAHNPQTEAAGLPMEFDIQQPGSFSEAAEGGGFVKIGVGVLAKEDDTYRFFTPYRLIQPAETTVEWRSDGASFRQVCAGTNGYAYRLEAEIALDGSKLRVTCKLTNTGSKVIETEQYAHDFFRLSQSPVGPGYEVECAFPFQARIPKPALVAEGRTIKVIGEITAAMKAAEAFLTPEEGASFTGSLRVVNPERSQVVTAGVSVPPGRITIHTSSSYICPEQFVRLRLEPGETKEWTRTYDFELKDHQP